MYSFDVVPLQGVGPLHLGMTRPESRVAMGLLVDSDKFDKKSPARDLYLDHAFQVFFDKQDRVEYIELSGGGPFVALYKGVNVHQVDAEEVLYLIEQEADFDEDDKELGYSYIFPALELSVWRPVLPQDSSEGNGRCFSTIGVGKPGYYSQR